MSDEEKLEAIRELLSAYFRRNEDGLFAPTRQTLKAIAELFAQECSICRRSHGPEVQHVCE